jgi:hypothetical protein
MSIYAIYRTCIWLPILVPTLLIVVVNTFGLRLADGLIGEMVAYSLVWGGLPYAVLAVWATWWVGGRPESQIKRLLFRAPLLMMAVFVPFALLLGLLAGALAQFVAVAVLGATVIMLLGYGYVGVAVLLRLTLGPRGSAALTGRCSRRAGD